VAVGFLTFHHGGGGEYRCAVGQQPSEVTKRCQRRLPLSWWAYNLGLDTTTDCDNITRMSPVTVSHQQWAPAFDGVDRPITEHSGWSTQTTCDK